MPEDKFWDNVSVPQSVLCFVPGWQRDRVLVDSMHTSNLGIAWVLIGSTLVWLCNNRVDLLPPEPRLTALSDHPTLDEKLHDLQCRFKIWLSSHKLSCSCRRFTSKSVHRTSGHSFPIFCCKAAQSPVIISWLADLTITLVRECPVELHGQASLLATCVWGEAEYHRILRDGSRFFDASEIDRLEEAANTFLFAYSELRRISISEETWLTNIY